MAITTAFCTSAKVELLQALHDFDSASPLPNAFKVALFKTTVTGTFGAATTNYSDMNTSPTDEAIVGGGGTGYTAGGQLLAQVTPTSSGTTAYVDFADTVWTLSGAGATLASDGCMIYNTTNGNRAVSVHQFSGSPSASGDGATFTIQWPTADASNAILRIA